MSHIVFTRPSPSEEAEPEEAAFIAQDEAEELSGVLKDFPTFLASDLQSRGDRPATQNRRRITFWASLRISPKIPTLDGTSRRNKSRSPPITISRARMNSDNYEASTPSESQHGHPRLNPWQINITNQTLRKKNEGLTFRGRLLHDPTMPSALNHGYMSTALVNLHPSSMIIQREEPHGVVG